MNEDAISDEIVSPVGLGDELLQLGLVPVSLTENEFFLAEELESSCISIFHVFTLLYDGNGRTARALFYWYLLKNDYDIIKYLSISRFIFQSKAQYGKAFLLVESDGLDVTYFVENQLKVLEKALVIFLKEIEKEN